MRTKYKRIGKRSLSIFLSVLIMISAMMLGSIATIEASAEGENEIYLLGENIGSNYNYTNWNTSNLLEVYKFSWDTVNKAYYLDVKISNQSWFHFYDATNSRHVMPYSTAYVYGNNRDYDANNFDKTNRDRSYQLWSSSSTYRIYYSLRTNKMRMYDLDNTNCFGIGTTGLQETSTSTSTYGWDATGASSFLKFSKISDYDYAATAYLNAKNAKFKLRYYYPDSTAGHNSSNGYYFNQYFSSTTSGDPSISSLNSNTTFYVYESDGKDVNLSFDPDTYVFHYNPSTREFWVTEYHDPYVISTGSLASGASIDYFGSGVTTESGTTKATDTSIVTVTVTPPADVAANDEHSAIHYMTNSVTVLDENDAPVTLTRTSVNTYTFEMPTSEVTVTADFKENYFVVASVDSTTKDIYGNTTSATGGTVSATSNNITDNETVSVEVRDPVTFTATAAGGYSFTGWTLTGTAGTDYITTNDLTTDTTITVYPLSDVTATATFTEYQGIEHENWHIIYTKDDYWSNSPDLRQAQVYKKQVTGSSYAVSSDYSVNSGYEAGYVYYADIDISSNRNSTWHFATSGSLSRSGIYWVGDNVDKTSLMRVNKGDTGISTNFGTGTGSGDGKYYNFVNIYDLSNVNKIRIYLGVAGTADNMYVDYTLEVIDRQTYGTNANVSKSIDIWAKRGTTRNGAEGRNDGTYSEYFAQTNTTVTGSTVSSATTKFQDTVNKYTATKGDTITITTTVRPTACNRVYVKAFVINGYAYGIISEPAAGSAQRKKDGTGGVYTCTYKIPENLTDTDLEITPVFFYFTDGSSDNKDNEYITFYAEDFEGAVKTDWGNTISCYAWYSDSSGDDKSDTKRGAIGGYPGQPMIYENGSYYMQVPKYLYTKTSGATDTETSTKSVIQGITMNNYYWDDVHFYKGNKGALGTNCQTYDYDDFVALMKYDSLESIIFSFKYRTVKDNGSNGGSNGSNELTSNHTSDAMTWLYDSFGTNGNGWNALVDYYDVSVDIFGNRRTKTVNGETSYIMEDEVENQIDENDSLRNTSNADWTKFLYVISDGYSTAEHDYIGYYATKWHIYNESGTHLADLPPSAFVFEIPEAYLETDLDPATPLDGFLGYSTKAQNYSKRKSELWAAYCNLYNAKDTTTGKYLYRGLPVMITYEKAIADKGARYDYGNRNDGRWYFSRKGAMINADIMIQIVDDDDNILLEEDTLSGNTGTATGASAYFTNTDFYGMIESGDVKQSSAAYFTFEADGTSTGKKLVQSGSTYTVGTDEATYEFVGWYMRTGSGQLYPSINVGTNISNTSGRRAMVSNATFVARYKEVVKSTEGTLIVNHKPLSTATAATVPTVHNGTGTTTVASIVITYPDNSTKTFTGAGTTLSLDPEDLYQASKVTVNLTSTPSDDNTFVYDLYNYESSTYYRSNEKDGNTEGSSNSKAVDTHADDSYIYDGTTGAKTVSYTYNYGDLFGSGAETKTLNFFSDFQTTTVTVYLKYYDRKIERNKATDISKEANTLTIPITVANGENLNNRLNTEVVLKVGRYLDNELCEYVLWNSQANYETGIQNETNYRVVKENGTGQMLFDIQYARYSESDLTSPNYTLHTDCFGRLQSESECQTSAKDGTKWVTYKDASGEEIAEGNVPSTGTGNISSVTIWAFNKPKKYSLNAYAPKNGGALTTEYTLPDGTKIYGINGDDEGGTQAYPETKFGFYNQRVGEEDENASTNVNVNYLEEYDHVPGYIGSNFRAYDNVTADGTNVSLVTDTENNKKEVFVFDGWYAYEKDGNTHKANYKITSDHWYGYRITTNMKIVAGYRKVEVPIDSTTRPEAEEDVGISLTNNGTDYYALNGENRTRLNTQLNVYGVADGNKENRIQKVSVIYVQFPATFKDVEGNVHTFTGKAADGQNGYMSSLVTDVKAKVTAGAFEKTGVNRITITDLTIGNGDKSAVYMDYTYEVSTDDGSYKVQLTNKNRYQFVLNMNADDHDAGGKYSAVVAFGAMKYDFTEYVLDGEGKPTSEIAEGKTSDVQWLVSDNYVDFITNESDT